VSLLATSVMVMWLSDKSFLAGCSGYCLFLSGWFLDQNYDPDQPKVHNEFEHGAIGKAAAVFLPGQPPVLAQQKAMVSI
jgi:hypothetical protein